MHRGLRCEERAVPRPWSPSPEASKAKAAEARAHRPAKQPVGLRRLVRLSRSLLSEREQGPRGLVARATFTARLRLLRRWWQVRLQLRWMLEQDRMGVARGARVERIAVELPVQVDVPVGGDDRIWRLTERARAIE